MSQSDAQDRFDRMLEESHQMTPEERIEQLQQQRLTLAEIDQALRHARREREARYEQAVERIEHSDDTPEVLPNNE